MKKFFEEPKLCLEQFSVMDQTLTGSSIQPFDENETTILWRSPIDADPIE